MKLINLREDVVDFEQRKVEREKKAERERQERGASPSDGWDFDDYEMSDEERDDLFADERNLEKAIHQNYGKELKSLIRFVKSPVMSGGFKTGYDLRDALWTLKNARKRGKAFVSKMPEKERRAIQKATLDDELYKKVMEYYTFWTAVRKKYGGAIEYSLRGDADDAVGVIGQLGPILQQARKYYTNAA